MASADIIDRKRVLTDGQIDRQVDSKKKLSYPYLRRRLRYGWQKIENIIYRSQENHRHYHPGSSLVRTYFSVL